MRSSTLRWAAGESRPAYATSMRISPGTPFGTSTTETSVTASIESRWNRSASTVPRTAPWNAPRARRAAARRSRAVRGALAALRVRDGVDAGDHHLGSREAFSAAGVVAATPPSANRPRAKTRRARGSSSSCVR